MGLSSGLQLSPAAAAPGPYGQMVSLPVVDGSFTYLPVTSGLIRCLAPSCGASRRSCAYVHQFQTCINETSNAYEVVLPLEQDQGSALRPLKQVCILMARMKIIESFPG